jgi:hypothetical protein
LYKNGKPVRGDEWARSGSEFTGVSDDRTLSKFSGDRLGGTEEQFKAVKGGRTGGPKTINVPLGAITQESGVASETLKSFLPSNFVVEDKGGLTGNDIQVTAPNGKIYTYKSKKSTTDAAAIKADIEAFISDNYEEPETTPQPPTPGGVGTFGATAKPRG